jgi:Bifunctional DNA primase/polymerase, N-terminal
MAAILTSSNTFRDWQPRYAERNIPTFPIEIGLDTKKPMVSNYGRFGLPASAEIARKFPEATAIGFMAGRRTGLTVLDVDTTDERVLADALGRHGQTRIIVRSGSGHHQAWFRHNGEGRHIRAFGPDTPIDILGGGFVVAPPSRGIRADYQFIQGGLDDLDRLPVLQNIEPPKIVRPSPASLDLLPQNRITEGKRNNSLWRYCMEQAHSCDDLESLIDVARTRNDDCLPLLDDGEVVKVAESAWGYTVTGQNWFGQDGARRRAAEVQNMVCSNLDAFGLLEFLRVHHSKPEAVFVVANDLAPTLRWTRKRLAGARRVLEETHLETVRRPSLRNGPALYRWKRLR